MIALKPDQILNEVLKVIMSEINSHLEKIFNDSLLIGYYLIYFKWFISILFHKEKSNKDFFSPKSYQLISLFNIVEKIMEVILAVRISYMATTHNLLPTTHFKS